MYCSNWHGGILRTNDIYLAKHVPLGLESKCGVRIVYLDPEDGMVGFFVVMVCRVRGHAACFPCFLLLSTFSALSLISPFLFLWLTFFSMIMKTPAEYSVLRIFFFW